jgi:hypothetical protein
MLIEIALPTGAGGAVEAYARRALRNQIQDWAVKHGASYTEKTVKGIHRLCFDDDRYYTLFMMSWDGWDWFSPRVVHERNKE